MRLRLFLSPLVLIARLVVSDVAFVYPPPFVSTTDFSSNIVMVEGEFKVIQWTNVSNPNNDRISVTMFQLNGTQFFGDAEYVTRNATPDTISTPWTVNTVKNLTVSPMFYLNLFLEGETTSLTNSHYFNISASSTTTTTSSTTSLTSSSSSSSSTSATTSSTAMATPSTPAAPVVATSGLSTGAKVGIAVGIIGAALLGVLASWFVLGRRRNSENKGSSAHPPVQIGFYEPVKMEPYRHGVSGETRQYPQEVTGSSPSVRYELSPDTRIRD